MPLILHRLPFGFQPIEAPYIVFHHHFYFFSLLLSIFPFFFLFLSFFPPFIFFFSLFFSDVATREASVALPPTVSLSTYLSRHLRDPRLHQSDMSFETYIVLWVTLRRPTFNGSWNGSLSQVWSIVAARTTV